MLRAWPVAVHLELSGRLGRRPAGQLRLVEIFGGMGAVSKAWTEMEVGGAFCFSEFGADVAPLLSSVLLADCFTSLILRL